jgi:hypothetical protein
MRDMTTTQFEIWLNKVNEQRKQYWDSRYDYKPYEPLKVEKGRKFIKLIDGTSVWGFVSMTDGLNKGVPVKKGDLLKPASWNSPAKHSRGNIFNGTDVWEYYGPKYL